MPSIKSMLITAGISLVVSIWIAPRVQAALAKK